jgi:hypothetical protein
MSRDATDRAKQASDRDMALSKQYGGQSDALHSQLSGIYTQNATNPQGMSQGDMNDIRTSAMESAGGSVAGAVGQGNLAAARTGNAGGYQAALADSARQGIATNSANALKSKLINTTLKEQQREEGVSGLQHLQSADQAGTLSAMGLDTGAINAETTAGQSGWFQNMTDLIRAGSGAATAAGKLIHG